MRFHRIAIAASQADTADPRTDPEDVPDNHVIQIPTTVKGTDQKPSKFALTAEGTAAQTVSVTFFALDEDASLDNQRYADDPQSVKNARKWYQVGAATVVTVGSVVFPATDVPWGMVYARVTGAPLNDAVLKIGFI